MSILSHIKIEFRLNRCYGALPVMHISLLVMNRLSKTEFAIFISSLWSLLPRAVTNQNLLCQTVRQIDLFLVFPLFKNKSISVFERQKLY